MIAAVFDVDRTLLPRTTAERIFINFLVRRGLLSARAVWESFRFVALHGRAAPVRTFRAHRPYLAGLTEETMTEAGEQCFTEEIAPRLSAEGIEEFRRHAKEGHRMVLLSGSLPYVIDPLARWLSADHAICSRMRLSDRGLAGRIQDLHPQGAGKALLVHRLANQVEIDLGRSYCYADHHSDASMLGLFGYPVCINPTPKLRAIADRLGWPVREFR